MIAVLDTGAISALAPGDERSRARLRSLRQRVNDIVAPTAVLAEGVFRGHAGHDYQVRRFLEVVRDVVIDRSLGLAAGLLRQRTLGEGLEPSGVDAIVAAVADSLATLDEVLVITSDPEDLGALLSHCRLPRRISLVPV